jgi:cytochrome b involved in lipid metabolism
MFNLNDKIYVKIDNHWFDLTNYKIHPGGTRILKKYHLKDASKIFNSIKGHNETFVEDKLYEFEIKDNNLLKLLN